MTVIKEYIKSEDVLNLLYKHKYDWGKEKYITELYNENLEQLIITNINEKKKKIKNSY